MPGVTQEIHFLVHTICKMANFVPILSQQPWQKSEIPSMSHIFLIFTMVVEMNWGQNQHFTVSNNYFWSLCKTSDCTQELRLTFGSFGDISVSHTCKIPIL